MIIHVYPNEVDRNGITTHDQVTVSLTSTLKDKLPTVELTLIEMLKIHVNVRENRTSNQEWRIQRHRQHWTQCTEQRQKTRNASRTLN